ncbi:MAG: sigma-70 family RNA polymerase sigma factor [Verrucomicrobiales bacterium]|nr:sigma-70 family RNA polymerase sigma factor [Verrucomicrobiales bacterium]
MAVAQSDEASRTRAREALDQLCRAYWYPLYAFVRNRGYASAEAQDLTQSFLLRFIETRGFAAADRERGRFRTYLLGALKHFLANEWHRARMQKRGGGVTFLEWDALDAEGRYALEPAHSGDPETTFDREWAVALTRRAMNTLRAEFEASGKGALLVALQGSLTGDEPDRGETARRLGMTEGALKVAVHRLRQRYRELVRAEVAATVNEPSAVDDEMRHLVAVLRTAQGASL